MQIPSHRRTKPASSAQKKFLIDWMSEDLPFARYEITNVDVRRTKWRSLATSLNEMGPAVKTVTQWQKYFNDLKSISRRKARVCRANQQSTEESSSERPVFVPRSVEEEKLYSIVAKDVGSDDSTPSFESKSPKIEINEELVDNLSYSEVDVANLQVPVEDEPEDVEMESFEILHRIEGHVADIACSMRSIAASLARKTEKNK